MLPTFMDMSVRPILLAEKPQTWAVRGTSIGGVQPLEYGSGRIFYAKESTPEAPGPEPKKAPKRNGMRSVVRAGVIRELEEQKLPPEEIIRRLEELDLLED